MNAKLGSKCIFILVIILIGNLFTNNKTIAEETRISFRGNIIEHIPEFRARTILGYYITDAHVREGMWTFVFIRDRNVCSYCAEVIEEVSKNLTGMLVIVSPNNHEAERISQWAPRDSHIVVDNMKPYMSDTFEIDVAPTVLIIVNGEILQRVTGKDKSVSIKEVYDSILQLNQCVKDEPRNVLFPGAPLPMSINVSELGVGDQKEYTLIAIVSANCSVCVESREQYMKIYNDGYLNFALISSTPESQTNELLGSANGWGVPTIYIDQNSLIEMGLIGYPTYVIVDPEGVVQWIGLGYQDYNTLCKTCYE